MPPGSADLPRVLRHQICGQPQVIFLYLIALLLVLLTLFVINRLLRMPIGRAWEALREDEIACRSLGLNPTMIKLRAFTIVPLCQVSPAASSPRARNFISRESFTFIGRPSSSPSSVLGAWDPSWA